MSKFKNHSANAQCLRLLEYLENYGSETTIKIRHKLDIIDPPARVFELRHKFGKNIVTSWENDLNPSGTMHRVGRYTLKAGKYKGGEK